MAGLIRIDTGEKIEYNKNPVRSKPIVTQQEKEEAQRRYDSFVNQAQQKAIAKPGTTDSIVARYQPKSLPLSPVAQMERDKLASSDASPDTNWGRVTGGTLLKGADQFATGLTSTGAWLEGAILKPVGSLLGDKNLYQQGILYNLNEHMKKAQEQNQQAFAKDFEDAGTTGKLLDKYGTATVSAVPQAALAMLTAGSSLGAQATTSGLQTASAAATSGLAKTIGNTVSEMGKNPQYWLSFLQSAGNNYEQAKGEGASDLQATSYALLTSLVNSAVESSGGIDTLPKNLQSAAKSGENGIKAWVKSALDEGREEVIQGAISQLTQTVYGKNNPLVGMGEDAVLSPSRALEEFKGGAIVGGILGGGQAIAGKLLSGSPKAVSEPFSGISDVDLSESNELTPPSAENAQNGVLRAITSDATVDAPMQPKLELPSVADDFLPGKRVNAENFNQDQINRTIELMKAGEVGMDIDGNVFRIMPENHIDNRTSESVSSRKVNAFQYDHPNLHEFMKQAANDIIADADISMQLPTTRRMERTVFGKKFTQNITESAPMRAAMNEGLTRNQIIDAAQRLINDKGQENVAAAKRLEIILDDMLTNGYTTVDGRYVGPNQEYIAAKSEIRGAKGEYTRQAEELPIWDMNAPDTKADVLSSDGVQSVGAAAAGFDPYTNQLQQFGAIPEGENPARPIDVPKRTAKNNKVSWTARTILEAAATPDSAVGDIGQAVVDGKFSYVPVTNKQTAADAETTIKRLGYQGALSQFKADVQNGVASEKVTALGLTLYNNAVNAGDTKLALDIAYDLAQSVRNGARATQAMRILKQLTPEGRLYMLQKEVSNINEQQGRLPKELLDATSGKPEITIDESLADAYLNAETEQDRQVALENIYQNIADQMPADWRMKWNAWRYMAMLANPRTHVRNILGNVGFQPLRFVKNEIAAAIETSLSKAGVNIERTKSFVSNPDMYKAAWNDYKNVSGQVSGNRMNDSTSEIESRRRIFNNSVLETVRSKNYAALEIEDAVFKKITYADSLAGYLSANGVTAEQLESGNVNQDLLDKAREYAVQEALKATYQDKNVFSNKVVQVAKSLGTFGEAVLPFKRTPANILVRGFEYSPFGLAKGLTYDLYKVKSGDMTASQAIDNIAAGLTGTALMRLGGLLASMGVVTGGADDDQKQADLDNLTGGQNYALNLPGGTSVTLDWLAPEALPFFMGVELEDSLGQNGATADGIMSAFGSISEPILEMSMLQSLNDLIDNVSYAASNQKLQGLLGSALVSYFSQAIPTIGGQIERSFEDTRMSTYTDKNSPIPGDIQYALGKASARIPGWDYQQIPYIDAWGRTENSGPLGLEMFNQFLNPAYTSQENVTKLDEEVQRLYTETGESGVVPDRAPRYLTVGGERIDLSKDQYVEYATQRGQLSYQLGTEMIQNPVYQSLPDDQKADILDDVYTYADALAKMEVSDYTPPEWIAKVDSSGVDPVTGILYHKSDANSETKRKMLMQDDSLSASEKLALDRALISETSDIDYSSEETFTISQMSDAGQRKWEKAQAWGMPYEDYAKYYPMIYAQGKKKAEIIQDLINAGMSENNAYTFWDMIRNG